MKEQDSWLLDMVSVVRFWPAHYMPVNSAAEFMAFVAGYVQGRLDLGIPAFSESEETILKEFEAWLRRKANGGPIDWIPKCIDLLGAGENSLERLFEELDLFLTERGTPLPRLEDTNWPPRDPATYLPTSSGSEE